MSSVPYLYVNALALSLYAIMLFAFLSAKKTPEIRNFLEVLVSFIVWTGGSILMRLQIFPGVSFWFYVSIMGLFSCGLLLYFFICSFVRARGYAMKIFWTVGTVIILIFTGLGYFLKPPAVLHVPGIGTVFLYDMDWRIGIPVLFFLALIISMLALFRRYVKEKGVHSPGVMYIIIGCVAIAAGNVIQIIPGNVFPWDTLSGAVFAVMLMFALYRKRMFRMTLIVSRSALMVVCALFCVAAAAYFVTPMQDFTVRRFNLPAETATVVIVLVFTVSLAWIYTLLRKLMDALFTREEQQDRLLKSFSAHISQTLDTAGIMADMVGIIRQELRMDKVYVLLRDGGQYAAKYSANPLDSLSFSIPGDSPCVNYLRGDDAYFVLSEFSKSPYYLSMWASEKELFRRLDVGCVMALRDVDDIIGLILLANKEKGIAYSYVELSFLQTVSSIASIALKNASLYERVYREARIDSLTGVFNYRFFVEKVNQDFEKSGRDSLSLLYLDLDDFKLFNQLYGTGTGDEALKAVADVIVRLAGSNGTVFRHSGKVFAVLLPGFDARETEALAREIMSLVLKLDLGQGMVTKPLTMSCGICVAPYCASSARELIENADLAVYNAKQGGKDRVAVFRAHRHTDMLSIAERAGHIVDRAGHSPASNYETYSHAVYALTAAIDAKDSYTFNHSENVAKYASVLATAAELSDEQIRVVYEAGLLHDIGKISIPEAILCKPGGLDDEEYEIMRSHVKNSIEMIRHLPSMDYVIPAAIAHHERWDGKGYPRGTAGEDIPVTGRCLAVADAFDAMTTTRPYREALSLEYAAGQIEMGAGTQFDPRLAVIFVDLIRQGEIQPHSDIVLKELVY